MDWWRAWRGAVFLMMGFLGGGRFRDDTERREGCRRES